MQARVWLLDGTDANSPLALHICDSDGCQRPPRARNQPRDKGKLLCEHHYRQQEQDQQQQEQGQEEQEQQQDASTPASQTAVYSGGARLGGVNGLFAPCGHVLGLAPQYGNCRWHSWRLLESRRGTLKLPMFVRGSLGCSQL